MVAVGTLVYMENQNPAARRADQMTALLLAAPNA